MFTSEERCLEQGLANLDWYPDVLARDRTATDENIIRCVDALHASECQDEAALNAGCDDMWQFQDVAAPGQECGAPNSQGLVVGCQDGFFCQTDFALLRGVCAPRSGPGQGCDPSGVAWVGVRLGEVDGPCQQPLFCEKDAQGTPVCRNAPTLGEACLYACGRGSACHYEGSTGICRAFVGVGESCVNAVCQLDAVCIGEPGQETCQARLGNGTTCTAASSPPCNSTCVLESPSAEQGMCETKPSSPSPGGACDVNSVVGPVCDAQVGFTSFQDGGCVCMEYVQAGGNCRSGGECATRNCLDGRCVQASECQ